VGNSRERVLMYEKVEEGERVFDMFAGIGYFSIPIATGGGEVTATEINPVAYNYLLENARLNDVEVNAFNDDCRNISVDADRVIMGHFDSLDFLDHALNCLDEGWIHLHDAVHEADIDEPEEEVRKSAEDKGREVILTQTRRIKSYSEGVWHVVVDSKIA
ncbi:MAG: class I SAM-dependent methyltransferase family protein, partial [Halobacteria archaeon]|nr:class I SAM-dependent methyltransferase family protein [Halobacteria archaeon]